LLAREFIGHNDTEKSASRKGQYLTNNDLITYQIAFSNSN